MTTNPNHRLIEVYCDKANRWTVLARRADGVAWTRLSDDDLDALLVLARGVVVGVLPDY